MTQNIDELAFNAKQLLPGSNQRRLLFTKLWLFLQQEGLIQTRKEFNCSEYEYNQGLKETLRQAYQIEQYNPAVNGSVSDWINHLLMLAIEQIKNCD